LSFIPAIGFAGLAAGAGVFKAANQFQQGRDEQAAFDQNAEIERQKADQARTRGKLNEFRRQKDLKRKIGRQRQAFAGAGVNINTGSPLEIMIDDLQNGILEIEIGKFNDEIDARGFESAAEQEQFKGRVARRTRSTQAVGSLLQTAGTLGKSLIGG